MTWGSSSFDVLLRLVRDECSRSMCLRKASVLVIELYSGTSISLPHIGQVTVTGGFLASVMGRYFLSGFIVLITSDLSSPNITIMNMMDMPKARISLICC